MVVYHCTNSKALPKILRKGLRPMKRGYICVSEIPEYAIQNGFAYFENQADFLYKNNEYQNGWSYWFLKAVGKKKRYLITIDIPVEVLEESYQDTVKNRDILYPEFKINELQALFINKKYFTQVEKIIGDPLEILI